MMFISCVIFNLSISALNMVSHSNNTASYVTFNIYHLKIGTLVIAILWSIIEMVDTALYYKATWVTLC